MRYGFVTYLNGTMFLKRTVDKEFLVTDAIMPSSQDPTLLEMLVCKLSRKVSAVCLSTNVPLVILVYCHMLSPVLM